MASKPEISWGFLLLRGSSEGIHNRSTAPENEDAVALGVASTVGPPSSRLH